MQTFGSHIMFKQHCTQYCMSYMHVSLTLSSDPGAGPLLLHCGGWPTDQHLSGRLLGDGDRVTLGSVGRRDCLSFPPVRRAEGLDGGWHGGRVRDGGRLRVRGSDGGHAHRFGGWHHSQTLPHQMERGPGSEAVVRVHETARNLEIIAPEFAILIYTCQIFIVCENISM